jgi:hypothetical protein
LDRRLWTNHHALNGLCFILCMTKFTYAGRLRPTRCFLWRLTQSIPMQPQSPSKTRRAF